MSQNEEDDFARRTKKKYELVLGLQRSSTAFEKCKVPVIAVMQGFCIGAGIDYSSACDVRLCVEKTKFTIKEVDIGLAPDVGTIQRFQKIVGNDSWFRDLAYTGRYFTP